ACGPRTGGEAAGGGRFLREGPHRGGDTRRAVCRRTRHAGAHGASRHRRGRNLSHTDTDVGRIVTPAPARAAARRAHRRGAGRARLQPRADRGARRPARGDATGRSGLTPAILRPFMRTSLRTRPKGQEYQGMKIDSSISAVVTGGASGLGRAAAQALAGAGARVAIFDINEEGGMEVAREIGGIFCRVDINDEQSVVDGYAKARAAQGQERVLVHCAMTTRRGKTLAWDKASNRLRRL